MGIPGPPAQTLATMIFDGVLERFPDLRIGVIEQGAIWVPSWMRQMESAFDAFARHEERLQALSLRPSEYVRRQIRFTPYPTEDVGWIIEQAGPEVCLFSSDYPHVEGGRRPIERFEASARRRVDDGPPGLLLRQLPRPDGRRAGRRRLMRIGRPGGDGRRRPRVGGGVQRRRSRGDDDAGAPGDRVRPIRRRPRGRRCRPTTMPDDRRRPTAPRRRRRRTTVPGDHARRRGSRSRTTSARSPASPPRSPTPAHRSDADVAQCIGDGLVHVFGRSKVEQLGFGIGRWTLLGFSIALGPWNRPDSTAVVDTFRVCTPDWELLMVTTATSAAEHLDANASRCVAGTLDDTRARDVFITLLDRPDDGTLAAALADLEQAYAACLTPAQLTSLAWSDDG